MRLGHDITIMKENFEKPQTIWSTNQMNRVKTAHL